ncbi:hypothetical protein ASZ90_012298 [hydrocarbon metagenome]|jgi:hypothetical protein|uniref:Uncharacterized protein n=2 Tax=root TaxID=1 RepID=A0A0W8FAU1_9ZZZZ
MEIAYLMPLRDMFPMGQYFLIILYPLAIRWIGLVKNFLAKVRASNIYMINSSCGLVSSIEHRSIWLREPLILPNGWTELIGKWSKALNIMLVLFAGDIIKEAIALGRTAF